MTGVDVSKSPVSYTTCLVILTCMRSTYYYSAVHKLFQQKVLIKVILFV